jgi:hypothetical protein
LDELREDLIKLRTEINEIKEQLNRLHRRGFWHWLRNPSHIVNLLTLVALILGAVFQMWINRPVVDFQLVTQTSNDFYTIQSYQLNPFKPPAHLFYFKAQNTGQTDISLDITVVAVNATVSTTENGNFGVTATARGFIQARSDWATWSFYVKVNEGVTSFRVFLYRYELVGSPDWLTTQIDRFATYNAINAQELTWVVLSGVMPLVYVAET